MGVTRTALLPVKGAEVVKQLVLELSDMLGCRPAREISGQLPAALESLQKDPSVSVAIHGVIEQITKRFERQFNSGPTLIAGVAPPQNGK